MSTIRRQRRPLRPRPPPTRPSNSTTHLCRNSRRPRRSSAPRRSLTAPFPISVPPPNPPSLHSSNDSGFCNESSPTPLSQSEGATVEEGANATDKESRDNIFAGVKLRKVVTNDRSAPMLS
ncbi:hypothetical protein CEXT_364351 [Caerostris extrusa]|uniref:Uncharacterized protein n=1 Tax=Caerostris extrusa TaxID=172846 RepID=A0AAV4M5A0_CAEEX|nr:hypothetical protein CEXT_364351 [Caerostris extrusa]